MNESIKAGMYRDDEDDKPSHIRFSLDNRTTKILLPDGEYMDIINPQYVIKLEEQLLELSKKVDIHKDKMIKQDAEMKKLRAAIKKLDNLR